MLTWFFGYASLFFENGALAVPGRPKSEPLKDMEARMSKSPDATLVQAPGVTLTIDGRTVVGRKGRTILEAALENGIKIPYLCYHPRISRTGACRICLVKVNDTMFKTACTEPVAENMKVVSEDAELAAIRKDILEMLLSEGDHNCLYCDANGACELQDLVKRYDAQMPTGEFPRRKREIDEASSKGLKRNEDRCVLCGRCVKACGEIQISNVWQFTGRGSKTHLTSGLFEKIGDSPCVNCGTCSQLCPTGAIMPQLPLGNGFNWELQKESSICIYCGVGCKIDFHKNKEGMLVKATGNGDGPNEGHLCVKGRFGFDFMQKPTRLISPLIKENGEFREAAWEEALDFVAGKLKKIKADSGPDSVGALASAKCSNEDNYLMQKFVRAVVGTNNIDHCARL
jgi:predicted molibdopterin-dependent oxidoreductase YjgC